MIAPLNDLKDAAEAAIQKMVERWKKRKTFVKTEEEKIKLDETGADLQAIIRYFNDVELMGAEIERLAAENQRLQIELQLTRQTLARKPAPEVADLSRTVTLMDWIGRKPDAFRTEDQRHALRTESHTYAQMTQPDLF